MSFLADFFNVYDAQKETPVCCPFDHYTSNGVPYKETNPSASINTQKEVFHCMRCGAGYSTAQFIQKILGCDYITAKKLQKIFNRAETSLDWQQEVLTPESKQTALDLGISEEVINELQLKTHRGTTDMFSYPVFMYGRLVDIRQYNKDHKPKVKSRIGAPAGLIIPFDSWRESSLNNLTLICAGEKDMAIARSFGFSNAITITGGEQTLPKVPELFRNRAVAIVYDNDEAGLVGAKKLGIFLKKYTPYVKVVTGFHEVCKEPKEDITDFFIKYNKTKEDLIQYIKNTPILEVSEEDLEEHYPIVDLMTASKPQNIGRVLQSNIQVVAVSEQTFSSPGAILAEKWRVTDEKKSNTMLLNEMREWELTNDNIQDILHLIDNNFKETDIERNIRDILKIPQAEKCVKISQLTKKTVFKAYITDMFETTNSDAQPMEYTAYSIDSKLESGKKYFVTYKLVPHPYKGQQLIMLITKAVQASDSISNFKINDDTKEHLNIFKNIPGTVSEKINTLTEKVKGILGYNGNNILIQTIDLAYHTALEFHFGNFKNVRGYLDVLIVGESRIGKSSTANALRETYELGVFTSLAGNSATIPGLVGGSNKTSGGSYQTRAGIIPQNHKGLIIFEEFGKSNNNVISELTDIRSSNEVRITRVAGTITLPAMVRMIALTNVKSSKGQIKSIASYPNGISIVTELVGTAEDIARYDIMLVLADKGNNVIDPFWQPETPYPKEAYQTRVRWVWSRTPEQIIITPEIGRYILEKANEINAKYDSHIKIFGTEAWKKITRLAIAVAGYVVSTDETYENIIVTKEHVDYAVQYFISIYDNPTFKLKEYVDHEKSYSEINEEGIANLQDIYTKYPALVLQLEQSASATKQTLAATTGLSTDDLNKALSRLTSGLFIRFTNYDIVPTERFRLGVAQINRDTVPRRLGE